MPPMEADTAYQGCLTSFKLHSRALAVGRTGAYDLEIAHVVYAFSRLRTCVTQFPDCVEHVCTWAYMYAYISMCRSFSQSCTVC